MADLYLVSCLTRESKVSNQLESPVRVSRAADINTMACSCVLDAGKWVSVLSVEFFFV
jgi:hypothetical protein